MAEPNSFDDYSRRLQDLATDAQEHGIMITAIVCDNDMLTRAETKELIWRGGWAHTLGLLEWAKHIHLTDREPRDI